MKTRPRNNSRYYRCGKQRLSTFSFKVCCMIVTCFLLLVAASALIYFLMVKHSSETLGETIIALPKQIEWTPECPKENIPLAERFDCYPENKYVDAVTCETRGCCFLNNITEDGILAKGVTPHCVYPKNYGYSVKGIAKTNSEGFEVPLQRLPSPSRYGDDIQVVQMQVQMQTPYRLRIKFYDPESNRYEVPTPKIPMDPNVRPNSKNEREIFMYSVTYNTAGIPFAVKVRRSDSDTVIFDTSAGGLTLSHHFLELTTILPSTKVYGLGEHIRKQFHHDLKWKTWSMYADSSAEGGGNLPGVHPMYLCVENDGRAHGVLLLNSNAMEATFQPTPAVTFRSIGGILDFYLFLGPTPENVIQQYTEAVGRPMMPPYWSLGLHVGRHGFHSISDVEKFLDGLRSKHMPVEVLTLDVDALEQYSAKSDAFRALPNFTTELHLKKQKLMLAIQPSIEVDKSPSRNPAYNVGVKQRVFITDKWGLNPLIGKRGELEVVYPDYGSSTTLNWWADVLSKLSTNVQFDGLWLTDNEPYSEIDGALNGCMNDDLNRPPYVPAIKGNTLYTRTLCMDATQRWKDNVHTHYHLHNLYGHSMGMATEHALKLSHKRVRKLLLSRSTFVGSGRYMGHWIEGIEGTWEGLQASIPAVMEFSLFGIPFVGANICGDILKSDEIGKDEELCLRWIQLGVFYPFSWMHNSEAGKLCVSGQFSKEFFRVARHAVLQRYKLLPYLYTLFHLAHTKGSTVMRPLLHEFPEDNTTHTIRNQFMWGPALLVSPTLEKAAKYVEFYLPSGIWYDFQTGVPIDSNSDWLNETVTLYNSYKPAVMHIRAGHIITVQQASNITATSRENPMKLLVALNSTFEAEGTFFLDDGQMRDSFLLGEYILVNIMVTKNILTVTSKQGSKVFKSNFNTAVIKHVRIMGLERLPNRITIDGSYMLSNKQTSWNPDIKVLDLKHILIPLERRTDIEWHF